MVNSCSSNCISCRFLTLRKESNQVKPAVQRWESQTDMATSWIFPLISVICDSPAGILLRSSSSFRFHVGSYSKSSSAELAILLSEYKLFQVISFQTGSHSASPVLAYHSFMETWDLGREWHQTLKICKLIFKLKCYQKSQFRREQCGTIFTAKPRQEQRTPA